MRITKLIFRARILLTVLKRNAWRSVRRICKCILGLKQLIQSNPVHMDTEGTIETAHIEQVTLFKSKNTFY